MGTISSPCPFSLTGTDSSGFSGYYTSGFTVIHSLGYHFHDGITPGLLALSYTFVRARNAENDYVI